MLEKYNAILDMIKTYDPVAHIGGGAVRDTLLQRPIKDIDLFLHDAYTDVAAKLLRTNFGYVKVGQWKSYEHFSDPAVVRMARFEKWDEEIPVCLIGLNSARAMPENLRRFDFGTCMAAWNGIELYTSPKYIADIEAQTFTLYRADNLPQFCYSMSRFNKLTADRYAGWKLAVPDEFEEFAREYSFRKDWYLHHDEKGELAKYGDLCSENSLRLKDR